MNIITGKVAVIESGIGIPDLIVEAYNGLLAVAGGVSVAPIKIGSVITMSDGSFSLSYDASTIKAIPGLYITVLSPDTGETPITLFKSSVSRPLQGALESFVVKLKAAQLTAASVPVPVAPVVTSPNDPAFANTIVSNYQTVKKATTAIEKGIKDFHQTDITTDKINKIPFVNSYKTALLSKKASLTPQGNFVEENASIATKHIDLLNKTMIPKLNTAISTDLNPDDPESGMQVWFYLTDDDKNKLDAFKNGNYYRFSESQIAGNADIKAILDKLIGGENGSTTLNYNNPILKYFRTTTGDESAAQSLVNNNGTAIPPIPITVTGNGVQPVTSGDIPLYIARLINDMPSPEAGTILGTTDISTRPDNAKVQQSVNAFQLQKGPAETTAAYDFNILQIAFDNVWQQLFDADITNLLNTGYQTATDRGVDMETLNKGIIDSNFQISLPALKMAVADLASKESILPSNVIANFEIFPNEWIELSYDSKNKLSEIADAIELALLGYIKNIDTSTYANNSSWLNSLLTSVNRAVTQKFSSVYEAERYILKLREQGERIIDTIRNDDYISLDSVLQQIDEKLKSNYVFKVYAADASYSTVNFGLVLTYRQNWEPLAYQVGHLMKTIPLAPKEERKFTTKTSINRKKSEKEEVKNSTSETSDRTTTNRSEDEIMSKVNLKATLDTKVEASYDGLFAKGSASVSAGFEADKDSEKNKKDFHEAVVKATQEHKSERNKEISTESSYTRDAEESGTLVNPNGELTVTYLFYELQKRYRISEQLYRIQPVVMVAQQVPSPEEITETWLIINDWMLRRNLLDKSFLPALDYVSSQSTNDKLMIKELKKNLTKERQIVDNLSLEVSALKEEISNRYVALENAIHNRIEAQNTPAIPMFGEYGYNRSAGDTTPLSPEAAKAYEKAAKEAHESAMKRSQQATQALTHETSTLHRLTDNYNKALLNFLTKRKLVERLMLHIKDNIFYYMQSIWRLENADQRYFRLINVQVPYLETEDRSFSIKIDDEDDIFQPFRDNNETKHKTWIKGKFKTPVSFKPLVEVAAIENPLGFDGNYMIFPMKQHNALTQFLSAPYVDAAFGAMDPDSLSNVGLDDYSKFITALQADDPVKFETLKPTLKKWLDALLADPLRNGDELVVPTTSLYIEALPGYHTLLDDFTLQHRKMDVMKVEAEVRKMELENIRYAARLLNSEHEDPDVEKNIVVKGSNVGLTVSDNQ